MLCLGRLCLGSTNASTTHIAATRATACAPSRTGAPHITGDPAGTATTRWTAGASIGGSRTSCSCSRSSFVVLVRGSFASGAARSEFTLELVNPGAPVATLHGIKVKITVFRSSIGHTNDKALQSNALRSLVLSRLGKQFQRVSIQVSIGSTYPPYCSPLGGLLSWILWEPAAAWGLGLCSKLGGVDWWELETVSRRYSATHQTKCDCQG